MSLIPDRDVDLSAVTVVVGAWRSAAPVDDCLRSVLPPGDVRPPSGLVVLNDADPATLAAVQPWTAHPDVSTVPLSRNTGFAGGVHAATSAVLTPWMFLLNDDAQLEPGALERLLRLLQEHPDPGSMAVVQASVRLADAEPRLTNSTGNQVSPDGYGYDRDWLVPWPPDRAGEEEPFGFCGAGALLRVSAVREVGGMDPRLFLYYEDTDLSWRLRLAGWRSSWCPTAVVTHRHGSSSVEGSELFRFYNERNRLLVLARDASVHLALTQWMRYPLTVASLTVHHGPRRARTALRLRALASACRGLPAALRQRRRDVIRVPRSQVEQLLVPPPARLGGLRA